MFPRLTKWFRGSRLVRGGVYFISGLIILAVLFYAEEDWRGSRAWKNYKSQLEASGEHLDFSSFIPPPVPETNNFATTPIMFSTYGDILDKSGNRIVSPPTNFVDRLALNLERWNDPVTVKPWPTNIPFGDWQRGKRVDLVAIQAYYRAPSPTNVGRMPRGLMPGRGAQTPGSTVWKPPVEFPVAPTPQSPAVDVLLALSVFDPVLREMREAAQMPQSRYPHNYNDSPGDAYIPALSSLTQCGEVLRLRAVAELANSNSNQAFDDVHLILYLADSLQNEPFLPSQSVRRRLVNQALQPIWEGLQIHGWSDLQLTNIERALARFNMVDDFILGIRAERVVFIDFLDAWEKGRGFIFVCKAFWPFQDDPDDINAWDRGMEATKWFLIPRGWFYQNDIVISQQNQKLISLVSQKPGEGSRMQMAERFSEEESDLVEHRDPYRFLAVKLESIGWKKEEEVLFMQSALKMAGLACALERYRLDHAEFPARLELLTPSFIEKLPVDIIDGKSLHYQRNEAARYLLYSVGWNEKDDGGALAYTRERGRPQKLDREAGDWVWFGPQ